MKVAPAASGPRGSALYLVVALIGALVVTACGGDEASPESGPTTTAAGTQTTEEPSDQTEATSVTETTAAPSSPAAPPDVDPCELLTGDELATAFPDGVPDSEASTGDNGQSSCVWGPATANLVVTQYPGEEFYSHCEICEEGDLGLEASLDLSTFLSMAMVRLEGATLQVIATGLSLDEAQFLSLVEAAVSRS